MKPPLYQQILVSTLAILGIIAAYFLVIFLIFTFPKVFIVVFFSLILILLINLVRISIYD